MGSRKSILLLEPDSVVGGVYEKYLKSSGFDVNRCSDGQTAVLVADSKSPDLIVMELQLPGHGGIEFLHEFKSYSDWQDVPVVINSFIPDRLTTQNKKQLGVESYCYKPSSSLKHLLSQVKLALG